MNVINVIKKLESYKPNCDYELLDYDAILKNGMYAGLCRAIAAVISECDENERNLINGYYTSKYRHDLAIVE